MMRLGVRSGGLAATALLTALVVAAGCGRAEPPPAADTISQSAQARAKAWAAEKARRDATEKAAAIAARAAAPDCPADDFKFIPGDQLTMEELAQLSSESTSRPVHPSGGGAPYRLAYAPFDYENYPLREGRGGVGVIYVRADAPDRRSIGGVLWSRGGALSSSGGDTYESRADGEALTIEMVPQYADQTETTITCIDRFRVTLSHDGVLTAGGRRIGQFR